MTSGYMNTRTDNACNLGKLVVKLETKEQTLSWYRVPGGTQMAPVEPYKTKRQGQDLSI